MAKGPKAPRARRPAAPKKPPVLSGQALASLIEKLKPLAQGLMGPMGLELVDVETALADGRRVVRVVVDRPWPGPAAGDLGDLGVTIGECAAVARKLSALLDEADGLDGPPYVLEVASPGLDRPLLKEEDFRRFSGRLAKIDLTVDGRKVRRKGRLATAEGPLRLIAPEGEIAFEYAPGLKASLIPEFEDLGQVPPKKGAGGEVDGGPINSVA